MNFINSKRRTGMGLLSLFAVLALVFGYTAAVYGQAETGSVIGTVTDPSGGVVPKATVTVRNLGTNAVRSTITDSGGNYGVTNLLPGTYSVTVEAAGLGKQEQRFEVTVGSRKELNFLLTLSVSTVVVEVQSEGGVQVNTQSQTLGQVISSQEIQELPSLTRNPYDFAANVGTASNADPSVRGVGVAFNGLRSSGTNILLDGTANNNEFTATVGQRVPLDSVQEFSVLTNNFTAEYGRASSAVVNVATKSGTNAFHGSAYEFNRVSDLAANSFENNAIGVTKPRFVRNQFGGSVGGPVKKDKLFFFGNIELIRVRSSQVNNVTTIDPALIALSNANTQAYFTKFGPSLRPGAKVTAVAPLSQFQVGGNPATQVCTSAPCSTLPGTTPAFDTVNYSVPGDSGAGLPQNNYELVGRVDWIYSNNTQVYGRYARLKEDDFVGTVSNSVYPGFDTGNTDRNNSFLASITHSFGPRFTSQTKFVMNRLDNFQPLGAQPAAPGLFFSAVTTTSFLGNSVNLPGYLPFTPGNGVPFGGPQNFAQLYQDFGFTKGSHNIRFGGSYTYLQDNRVFGAYETPVASFNTSGGVTNASLNRLINGVLRQFQAAIFPQGNFPCKFTAAPALNFNGAANPNVGQCVDASSVSAANPNGNVDATGNVALPVGFPSFSRSNRYHEFAGYLQDAWRLNSRVTLNAGVRWEYFGIQHNVNPFLDSNFYFGGGGQLDSIRTGSVATVPTSPIGGLWRKNKGNFSPRLGLAWDVFGNGKTVVRGGYGISYERNFGNVTFNVIQNPPNYAVISLQAPTDIPVIPVTTNPAGPLAGNTPPAKAFPKVSLRAVNPNIGTAYAHLFSLTVERELWHNFVIGADYSGSRGEKLYDIANINRTGSGNFYDGDPCSPAVYAPFTTPTCANGFTGAGSGNLTRLKAVQYSNINFRSDNGISKYNALVVRGALKNFSNTGLTLAANYTYSHAIDELSDTFSSSANQFNLGYLDAFNPRLDLGNAYFDLRHSFSVTAIWAIPFGKHTTGWKKQVFDGWEIVPIYTAQTGSPFTISDCSFGVSVCPRAFVAAGQTIPNSGASKPVQDPTLVGGPGTALANPNSFVFFPLNSMPLTAGGTSFFDSSTATANQRIGLSDFGPFLPSMTGRNKFKRPGQWNMDLAVRKTFFLTERFKLQASFEGYDLLNHSNLYLGSFSGGGSDAEVEVSPGYIPAHRNGTGNLNAGRNVQLALRLVF